VSRLFVLGVALLPASMLAAVKGSLAFFVAIETPVKKTDLLVRQSVAVFLTMIIRLHGLIPGMTGHLLLHLSTVAVCCDGNPTITTHVRVAGLRTLMLAAGHEIPTGLATAPALVVVCFDAPQCQRALSTKALLRRALELAGRTRSGMTLEHARVRARPSELGARLPARMGRQSGDKLGVHVLTAPAVVHARLFRQGRIAVRAPPRGRRRVLVLLLSVGVHLL
jgi:hypothetical protein